MSCSSFYLVYLADVETPIWVWLESEGHMGSYEKISIYVPDALARSLDADAKMFEVLHGDGHRINRNKMLGMIISGFYDTYAESFNEQRHKVTVLLDEAGMNGPERTDLARSIVEALTREDATRRKGVRKARLALRPTLETELLLDQIADVATRDDYLSRSLRGMFESYCAKPSAERERIVYKERFDALQRACEKHAPIVFSTPRNASKRHRVVPYKMSVGKGELLNYLVCYEEADLEHPAKSFRLSRIESPRMMGGSSSIPDEVKRHLKRMVEKGAQFAINSDEEAVVRMSDEGMDLYERIYLGRPEIDSIEPGDGWQMCHFSCSDEQLFQYFRRFPGGSAVVLSQASLRQRIVDFHRDALEAYERETEDL